MLRSRGLVFAFKTKWKEVGDNRKLLSGKS